VVNCTALVDGNRAGGYVCAHGDACKRLTVLDINGF
jgi:hypothetical protein